MSKLDIYQGLAVVLFFPFIFGCIVAKSNITTLLSIDKSKPMIVKIDSLTKVHTGSSGSGETNITAHFTVDKINHTVNFTADGANPSDYVEKDSVKIWLDSSMNIARLRDINPTKEAYRERYLGYLFSWGIMVYPFLIILPLFLWEKRKQKLNKLKEE